jgi:hypothetical protein
MKSLHYKLNTKYACLLPLLLFALSCGGKGAETGTPPVWRPDTQETMPVPQTPVTYISFDGTPYERYVWEGKKIALLSVTNDLDPAAMKRWLEGVDAAYNYYAKCTGREPHSDGMNTYINERSTITSVPATCGAGCGYVGAVGVEIAPDDHFSQIYEGVRDHNQFSQVLFYELGRNFWFYSDQLAYKADDPIVTGYAVFMRFVVVEAANLQGGPFNNWTFPEFRNAVRGLLGQYLANETLTWENTLGVGAGYPGTLGGTDLFASFCLYLMEHYGGATWVENVWKFAGQRPRAKTTQDAVDNWIIASSLAAKTNLASLYEEWRWPVSNAAKDFLNERF